jgi:hypothetical protein
MSVVVVISQHLLNVFVQLANKRGLKKKKNLYCNIQIYIYVIKNGFCINKCSQKGIPVAGRGGPKGWETSRLPHVLEFWLTDGGEAVSLMHWLGAPYLPEHSWYSFLIEAESTPGP